jgi:phage terminase large subunit-like protein
LIQAHAYRDTLTSYCDDVQDGSVVACDMVKAAVARYQRDLARQQTPDFPYRLNQQRAERSCQFFPLLLRHSIGEFVGHPFHLSPWQAFINWNLFGWEREDGTRRFRRAFISVARKNGKSSYCAGLSLLLTAADREAGAEVYIGATKLDQARIIHKEANRMLRQSPYLGRHASVTKDNVAFEATNSFLRPLGSDRPYDGLNPHGVFFDELHAWQEYHRDFYATMTTGSAARTQPMQVMITTAGNDRSRIYNEELAYTRGVIKGDWQDDSTFGIIYEIDETDDPFDSAVWVKANPNLGVSVKLDYLAEQATKAKNKPQARHDFMRYHCNRTVSSVENGITAELWDSIAAPLSNWDEADAIAAGVDLGGKDDLAAYGLVARFKVGESEDAAGNLRPVYRYEMRSRAFISEESRRDLNQQPWSHWIHGGQLAKCRYVVASLRDSLLDECEQLGIQMVAFDPYNASQLGDELDAAGLTAVKMPQAHHHFNEVLLEFQNAAAEGRLRPAINDSVLRWCALNMSINRNSRDQVMPDKKHSKEKIDAAVASLMAMRAVMVCKSKFTGNLFIG